MSRKQQPFWKSNAANPPKPIPVAVQKPPLKVMVAVFTGPERSGWVHPSLSATLLRLLCDQRILLSYVPIHAIYPVCSARNTAVREYFLKSDSEVLVLFDNDVAPPANVADAICSMPEECNVAVLPYWVWLPNERHTMPCFGYWEDGVMIIPDPTTLKPGWQEMGAGGTGAMFIRRKVFTSPDKLQAPFFKIISTADKGQVVSEDVYFTGRAAEAGFPTWVNTDFICSHFHTVDLAEINFGTVMILKRFTDTITKRYGDIGIKLNTLIQELHPELEYAAKSLGESVAEAYAENQAQTEAKERQDICREAIKESK
jgi:hypothetical protein